MKILFWNIGKQLTESKKDLVKEAIDKLEPDVFCIAEGSTSIDSCLELIDVFNSKGYHSYYTPLFYRNSSLKLNYKYKANGLKVFIKDAAIASEPFSFSLQRQSGRIIVLKCFINFRKTSIIFLHNKSKSGNREVTDGQRAFIHSLNEMLNISGLTADTEREIILGDFNLEPWDNILRHKDYLETNFLDIHNKLSQRGRNASPNYFNPLVDRINLKPHGNLGGTYYSDGKGWALFDFVLYDTTLSDISYEVVTKIGNGTDLLSSDITKTNTFLIDEFDHLPIISKINN